MSSGQSHRVGDENGFSRPLRLLLDTNVWLDNYLPQRAGHEAVQQLLTKAIASQHLLLYPATTSKDVFYMIARFVKGSARQEGNAGQGNAMAANEIAWGCIDNMDCIATPVGMDLSDVWIAKKHKRIHADYEDDLVIAAALRAKADYLVTSDERLLRVAPVATVTPAGMLALLEAETAARS